MKKLLGTTAIGLALAVSPAMAGPQTDVDQHLSINMGSQTSTNSATGNNVLNMSQSATNTGNVLDKVGDYDDVSQDADIPQTATNSLVPDGTSIEDFTQDAENMVNYVNIIDGTTGDIYGDLRQDVDGGGIDVQTSTNRIEINDDEAPDVTLTDVSQRAWNTGNYASIDDSFDFVTQIFSNPDDNQVASNFIGGDAGGNDSNVENRLVDVDQTAGNTANMLLADDFRSGSTGFLQELALSVDQEATNTAWFELRATGVEQSASNVANYADVNGVDGKATQKTGNLADQDAYNFLLREDANDNGSGSVDDTAQSASNYVNIFKSEIVEPFADRPEQDKAGNQTPDPEVEQLEQYAGDSQRAVNEVSFGQQLGADTTGPDNFNTTQDATNVMNMAQVQTFADTLGGGTLAKQTAAGAGGASSQQLASNTAFREGVESGNVVDFSQNASNNANLIYAGNLPSINGVDEFDQSLQVPQLATNTITTVGNLTEVSQSASNVGNVISDLD